MILEQYLRDLADSIFGPGIINSKLIKNIEYKYRQESVQKITKGKIVSRKTIDTQEMQNQRISMPDEMYYTDNNEIIYQEIKTPEETLTWNKLIRYLSKANDQFINIKGGTKQICIDCQKNFINIDLNEEGLSNSITNYLSTWIGQKPPKVIDFNSISIIKNDGLILLFKIENGVATLVK